MTDTHQSACNTDLHTALKNMAVAREKAQQWVHEGAELDRTSERLMGDLVIGDRDCIEACLAWLNALDVELPVTVNPGPTPYSWRLDIDAARAAELEVDGAQMLAAMDHLLFEGPPCHADNPHYERMRTLGIPDRLRQDMDA